MSKKGFNERLEDWVRDLDRYCKEHEVDRKQAVGILLDNGGLGYALKDWKESIQFLELVEVIENVKKDKITGFAKVGK